MMVEPKEKLAGSTSVACWLERLVKGSELNCTSGTVAGGSEANGSLGTRLECELEPQLMTKRTDAVSPRHKALRRNITGRSRVSHIHAKTLDKVHRTSSRSQDCLLFNLLTRILARLIAGEIFPASIFAGGVCRGCRRRILYRETWRGRRV